MLGVAVQPERILAALQQLRVNGEPRVNRFMFMALGDRKVLSIQREVVSHITGSARPCDDVQFCLRDFLWIDIELNRALFDFAVARPEWMRDIARRQKPDPLAFAGLDCQILRRRSLVLNVGKFLQLHNRADFDALLCRKHVGQHRCTALRAVGSRTHGSKSRATMPTRSPAVTVFVEAKVPSFIAHTGNAVSKPVRYVKRKGEPFFIARELQRGHSRGELVQASFFNPFVVRLQSNSQCGSIDDVVTPERVACVARELQRVVAIHQVDRSQVERRILMRAVVRRSPHIGKQMSASSVDRDTFVRRARMAAPDLKVEVRSSNLSQVLIDSNSGHPARPRLAARCKFRMRRNFRRVDSQLPPVEVRIRLFVAGLVFVKPRKAGVINRSIGQLAEAAARGQMIVREHLCHQHADQFLLRINPKVRVENPAPRIASHGKLIRTRAAIGDDAKAESKTIAVAGQVDRHVADMILRHLRDRFAFQHADSFKLPAAKQHVQKSQVVGRGGNQSATAGIELPRLCAVVGREPKEARLNRSVADGLQFLVRIDGEQSGQPILFVRWHVEERVVHLQRTEKSFVKELFQREAGCDFDHSAQHVGRHAVIPSRAGFKLQRNVCHPIDTRADCFRSRFKQIRDVVCPVSSIQLFRSEPSVSQAGPMSQQIVNRNFTFGRDGFSRVTVNTLQHTPIGERGQEL